MSLSNATIVSVRRGSEGAQDIRMSFSGDGAYPAGGTAEFTAFVAAAIKAAAAAASDSNIRGAQPGIEIVDIIPGDCATLVPLYDKANDKLKVLVGATWVENAVANISATTFNLTVLCK